MSAFVLLETLSKTVLFTFIANATWASSSISPANFATEFSTNSRDILRAVMRFTIKIIYRFKHSLRREVKDQVDEGKKIMDTLFRGIRA
jgi:hypothetical protein